MKIVVHAYQEYGKTIKKPRKYEFCCWKTLDSWLHSVSVPYMCEECKKNDKK